MITLVQAINFIIFPGMFETFFLCVLFPGIEMYETHSETVLANDCSNVHSVAGFDANNVCQDRLLKPSDGLVNGSTNLYTIAYKTQTLEVSGYRCQKN